LDSRQSDSELRPGHTIVRITTKWSICPEKNIRMRKFEIIQTKLSLLGVHNDDDGRKITIDDNFHLIGQ